MGTDVHLGFFIIATKVNGTEILFEEDSAREFVGGDALFYYRDPGAT